MPIKLFRRINMTRREFLKTPQMNAIRNNLFSSAVIGYVIAGLTLYFGVIKTGNYFAMLDVVLILACALLIHLLQSRAAAIVLAAYAVLNVVVTSVSNGRFSGWWVALVGVYAVIYTFKFQKAWKDYQNDNAE